MRDLKIIQSLVGAITEEDLKYVDSYVCDSLGIFIPSVGFCGYAIQAQHTHPTYSFVLLLSPETPVIPTTLTPDSNHYLVAMLPPDVPHEEKVGDQFSRYIALFLEENWVEKIYAQSGHKPPRNAKWQEFFVSKDIMRLLDRFMDEYDRMQAGYQSILASLSTILSHDLIRNSIAMQQDQIQIRNHDIQAVLDYIHQNYAKPISMSELSASVGLSYSAFTRKFKKETNMTPMQFLIKIRLEKAKKLLRSKDLNVTEIALQCGFSSTAHFTTSFKKHLHHTPSEYKTLYTKKG